MMNILSFTLALQTPTAQVIAPEVLKLVSSASEKLYGHPRIERAWKYSLGKRKSISNGVCDIYMSLTEPNRISSISSLDIPFRMRNGPQAGEKFKTTNEWEQFGFAQIHKVWTDVDGLLVGFAKVGELSHGDGGVRSWASDSNTVSLTWFTVPVGGKHRQFGCTLDMATGKVLHASCVGFMNTGKYKVILDNSKKRKIRVGLPPG